MANCLARPCDAAGCRVAPSGFVVLLLSCASPVHDAARLEANLVGGSRTSATAWPNVVWLERGCTATLIHERVALFAAHCTYPTRFFIGNTFDSEIDVDAGTAILVSPDEHPSIAVNRCESHPEGLDLAYCVLDEPVDVPVVPLMSSCERDAVTVGQPATLVGFGFGDGDDPAFGIKRSGETTVRTIGTSFIVGDEEVGTCRGDSGGPAFVRFGPDEEHASWRVLGVLSAGRAGTCGPGHYTDVSAATRWLETASGHDLTPCTSSDGAWAPGAMCVAPQLDSMGEPSDGPVAYTETCGPAFSPSPDCSVRSLHSRMQRSPSPVPLLFLALLGSMIRRRRQPRQNQPGTRR